MPHSRVAPARQPELSGDSVMVDDESRSIVIEADGLSKAFGGVRVLSEVSVQVRAGDFILLRGANGSGKTTLLNLISGLLPADSGTLRFYPTASGVRTLEIEGGNGRGRGLTHMKVARSGTIRSWQDVRLFGSLQLLDNLSVAAESRWGEWPTVVLTRPSRVREEEKRTRAASFRLLDAFGLGHLASRRTLTEESDSKENSPRQREATGSTISLGQAKRASLARACRAGASVLLLDEPLSGLDEAGVESVLDLLSSLNEEHGTAIIIVEHESHVKHLLDVVGTTWRIQAGRVVEEERPTSNESTTSFHQEWLETVKRDAETCRELTLPGDARMTVLEDPTTSQQPPILKVRDLEVHRGGKPVLPPVSFSLAAGGVGLLEAPNGWGKSSIAEALAGLLPISRGEARLEGRPLSKLDPWERRRLGLTLLQSRSTSFPRLSVRETLDVCGVQHSPAALKGLFPRTVSSLSGGERQRLLLLSSGGGGRSLVSLWDEPFLSLDEEGIDLLTERVRNRENGQSFLILAPSGSNSGTEV